VILALALSPSLDVTYEVDTLRIGGITRPERINAVAGGKALNMARAAAALGGRVRAVAQLGGATGERVAGLLDDESIPMTLVPVSRETRTCIAIVESEGNPTSTDVYEAAAPVSAAEWGRYTEAVHSALTEHPDWVALSGSIPDGVPLGEVAQLLRSAATAGARVAIDTSGEALRALVGAATLVKVNREEVEELLEIAVPDALAACRALVDRFGVDAVVTDGVRGAAALVGGVERLVDPPPSPGRFPAGSGDAFLGGLLVALDAGDSLESGLNLARQAAERNAAVPGQGRLAVEH
jgi:1-phosphofructokinase family hexose kinase